MKINIDSLLTFLYRKNEKYLYILFFFFTTLSFGQMTDNTAGVNKSYTVPTNVTSIKAEVWGAGGSGGGSSSQNNSGSGAGGGGYTTKTFNVIAGDIINYTVGAGATAGAAGADGNDGNASSLIHTLSGTSLIGNGGTKGNANSAIGGAGGTGIGGIVNTSGSNGGAGGSSTGGNGGDGGNALGTGGSGQSNSNGSAGTIPGGGGGGGEYLGTSKTGGAGANGQVILTFISVSSVSPSSVCTGSTITITGTNFAAGTTTVSVNGTPCTSVTVVNSTTITAVVAAGTTSGVVLVTNPNGTNNGKSLTVSTSPDTIGGGSSTVCVGSSTPAFTNSVIGGTWSVSNGTGSATITAGGIVTGVSVGSVTVIYTLGTCSVSMPITVINTPAITSNPSSVSVVSGANTSFTVAASNSPTSYTWQVSNDGGASWNTVSNGGVYSNATTATLNISGVTIGMNGYLYRASATNNCGTSTYSSNATLNLQYCTPTFNTSNIGKMYIRSFRYVGVLNDEYLTTNISTQSGTNGAYQDFTTITPIAEQVRGTVVNVEAISTGTDTTSSGTPGWGRWMAWVDWNIDGTFSSSEVVYSLQDYSTGSVTFGFVIPSNQALGNYRIRISVMSNTSTNPCGLSTAYGEVEDYLFKVVEDNNAKLDTTKPNLFFRCGSGEVPMIVYGADANAVSFKWYDAKYGGNLLNTGSTYSPTLSTTTTYYVTAVDTNGKETPFRYPIIARIDPQPEVVFSPTPQTICGEDDPYLLLSVGGDSRQVVLLDEKFNTGLGAFVSVKEDSFVDTYNTPAYSPDWVMKPSPLVQKNPPHLAIASSIASGYFGGNFAIMNTDVRRNVSVKRNLVSTATYDTTPFLPNKIKLNFDLYYFSIALVEADGYIKVEYSLNGTTWSAIKTYVTNEGNPLIWNSVSLDLDALGVPRSSSLKIRFSVFSRGFGTSVGYYENVATLDNIKLYGDVPLDRDFDWSGLDNVVLYDKTCTTPLGGTLAREVCVKPPLDEFEKPYWTFSAHATFENGCPAFGTTVVYNDTKVWREPGIVDWNQGAQWKPSNVPDIKKCVIVRTPVELPTNTDGTHGLARSVIVKSEGSLFIKPKSSLEIQNYIKNEGPATNVIVDSDANLKQNNDAAVNIGNITVKRISNMKRLDYTYWGTPVKGQNLRNFSPNTLTNRFYVYNESNDYFDGIFVQNLYPIGGYSLTPLENADTYNFIEGKGYAIRAPNDYTTTNVNFEGVFVGVPNNGDVTFNLIKSGFGNNLVANPYPSNINFETFYNQNKDKINKIAYFWTNTNYNPDMQGSSYPIVGYVNNYAVYTGTGGVSAPYGFDPSRPPILTPNYIIKPGQGFLVQAHTPGTIHFYNIVRDKSNDGVFFNTARSTQLTKDRYWIELKTPLNFVSPILIGYVEGASNNFDVNYDALLMIEGADSFYTVLEDKKLVIEGRNFPLNTEDQVMLGATFYEAGIHEISLAKKEGIFASTQQIYLWDKKENIYANLSTGSYKFYADQGDNKTRFEILYKPASALSTNEMQKKQILVYKEAENIIIEAEDNIEKVTIFDTTGRLVKAMKSNSKKLTIEAHTLKNGVWLLEIKTPTKVTTKKIIK